MTSEQSPSSKYALFLLAAIFPGCAQPGGAAAIPQEPTVAEMAAETGTIPVGRYHLRYRVEGTGTPAIVIGSATYSARLFSDDLRRHLRLVALDYRTLERSAGPLDTLALALDTLIDDVERARQALSLGRVVVIGHSANAYLALEYAKKYPQNVSHVVMIGISPELGPAHARAADEYWTHRASRDRRAAMDERLRMLPDQQLERLPPGEAFIKRYIRNGPRIWFDPHFDSSPLWEGVDVNMDMFKHVWGRVYPNLDITQGLDRFDRPVFLALGRYDFLLAPPEAWDPVAPKFRRLTIRVFERSGHTPQYEEGALFDKELLRWLSQNR